MMSQEQETAMLDQPDPGCRPVVYRATTQPGWWWQCDDCDAEGTGTYPTMQAAFTDAHHHATRHERTMHGPAARRS